jgi:CTD kinase subunit alpha
VGSLVIERQVGVGTYGTVFSARHKETDTLVAMKKIKMERSEREGFPITAIREIRILNALKHDNIVELKEVVMFRGGLMAYCFAGNE